MFNEEAPLIVKDDTVVVSEALQEAIVKVDEEGATAGAFTGKEIILSLQIILRSHCILIGLVDSKV